MKFQRTDLIARVKDAIAAQEQAVAARNDRAAASYAERMEAHHVKTGEAWKRFADVIRLRLRTGRTVTDQDIPETLRAGRYGYIQTWTDKPPVPGVPDTAALQQLLVLLEAATDDEITTSSLERMGFRTAQLFTTR